MGFAEQLAHAETRSKLHSTSASKLLHGSLRTTEEQAGWVRPWRFTEAQMRTISSAAAWHPGLFRQMAECTAGIFLDFSTDASELALEVEFDSEPSGTSFCLNHVDEGGPRQAHDGVSCDFDGTHLEVRFPERFGEGRDATSLVRFSLPEAGGGSAPAQSLPGLDAPHRVRIWLPCLRSCRIRKLFCNGKIVEPTPAGDLIIALGDSITQGFVADDPARTWPALLGDALGCEVLNQGVGGQVFQVQSLGGMASAGSPKHVIVAFGANYRYEPYGADAVRADIRRYLSEVSALWPKVPTWVITPFGYRDGPYEQHPESCFDDLVEIISDEAARHSQMRTVVGSGLLPGRKKLLADGYEHPNAEGNAHIAERMTATIKRSGEAVRRKANPSGRSFTRDEKTGRFVADPERSRGLELEGIDLDEPELDLELDEGYDPADELEATGVLVIDPSRFAEAEPASAPHWEDLDV